MWAYLDSDGVASCQSWACTIDRPAVNSNPFMALDFVGIYATMINADFALIGEPWSQTDLTTRQSLTDPELRGHMEHGLLCGLLRI